MRIDKSPRLRIDSEGRRCSTEVLRPAGSYFGSHSWVSDKKTIFLWKITCLRYNDMIFWNIDSNRRNVAWSTLYLRKNRLNPNKLRLLQVNLCDPVSMSLFLRSSLRTFEGSRDGFGSSAILSQKYFFRCFPQSPHDFKTTPRPDLLH